ncbi:MAG TPA: acyl-CoA dehydrogenase family protein [Acidimicrobiales bacterium]|nr:acyl-CoA dehydrogenase family protein [Acidimicrobiales bacterium]
MAPGSGTDQLLEEVNCFLDESWDLDLTVGEWWERLARSGWGFPTWPTEWFGKGLDNDQLPTIDAVFRERRVLGAPGGLGQMMGGPVLMRHGNRDQQERHLWNLASGAESWCQFFSEPGSGSDLASAQTRAVRDGDEWVVNGQKVWTSGAKTADRGMLVARVDMDAPKHAGLGYFIIEVDQPDIDVRPLKQMTGDSHFNEVFFTDARVADRELVGRPGDGWAAAVTTLAFERSGRAGVVGAGFSRDAEFATRRRELRTRKLGDVLERAGTRPSAVDARNPGIAGRLSPVSLVSEPGANRTDPVRQTVTRYYIQSRVNAMTQQRARAAAAAGKGAGPASSITKLARSVATRINRDVGPAILGASGMLAGPDAPMGGAVAHATMQAPSTSIAGGTDEIQHNIIGERVLGLPREPQVDRDVPFKDLKVGTIRTEAQKGES